MNKKTVLLFQDFGDDSFDLEGKLAAVFLDESMVKKAYGVLYNAEDDYGYEICGFKTMAEITGELDKNKIEYETVDIRFIDYNVSE